MPLYPQGGGLYPNSIDNVILTDMADGTVKGRAKGAGLGDPQDLTAAQLSLLLGGPNFRNILGRNGGFEVWQRGAGGAAGFVLAASTMTYTADGWCLTTNNNSMSCGQIAGIAPGSRWCAYVARTAGQIGTAPPLLEFPLDTDEIVPMRGQIVTLSMTLQAGPGWSALGGTAVMSLAVGTGAASKYSAFTSPITIVYATPALTTVPTRFVATSSIVVPANATQASVYVAWTPVGTAPANDLIVIDDVQLEIGSVATPFERRPFESELAACKRHYEKTFNYGVAPAQAVSNFAGALASAQAGGGSAGINVHWRFSAAKRVSPTMTFYNPMQANANFRDYGNTTDYGAAIGPLGETSVTINATVLVPNNVQGLIHASADAGI